MNAFKPRSRHPRQSIDLHCTSSPKRSAVEVSRATCLVVLFSGHLAQSWQYTVVSTGVRTDSSIVISPVTKVDIILCSKITLQQRERTCLLLRHDFTKSFRTCGYHSGFSANKNIRIRITCVSLNNLTLSGTSKSV